MERKKRFKKSSLYIRVEKNISSPLYPDKGEIIKINDYRTRRQDGSIHFKYRGLSIVLYKDEYSILGGYSHDEHYEFELINDDKI